MTTLLIYLFSTIVLLALAYYLFRVHTRREYREKGQLSPLSSFLELGICLAYAAIPYLYNPPCWPYVWSCASSAPGMIALLGYLLIASGAMLGFGSMAWLGVSRSFGRKVGAMIHSGPYRFTRNPQVVGGVLMVAGIALLWPSWYGLGWVVLWIGMFHPMVLTEEEHLRHIHGDEYRRYCESVPRYLRLWGQSS